MAVSIQEQIRRIVRKHRSIGRRQLLKYFDEDNDPKETAEEILDALIDSGELVDADGQIRIPKKENK